MLHDELFRVARTGNNVAQTEQLKAVAFVEKKLQKKMHMKNEKNSSRQKHNQRPMDCG